MVFITVSVALVGSIAATLLNIPLGAMFGAMVAVIIAGKLGLSMSLSTHTITFVQLILGMVVGLMVPIEAIYSGFPISLLLGLVSCMLGQVAICYYWLYKREGWSKTDSLLGSLPGAMAAVLALNESQDVPSTRVVFTHTVRLVCLTVLSGLIVSGSIDSMPPEMAGSESPMLIAIILVAWIAGVVFEKIGFPAPYMVTGMVVTITFVASLPSEIYAMPPVMIFIATSALGALIGLRLAGVSRRDFFLNIKSGIIATLLSLLVTVFFAISFSYMLDKSVLVLIMSWVPGSIEAMTIAAIYLGLEPALIMMSHVIRLLLLHCLPVAHNLLNRMSKS